MLHSIGVGLILLFLTVGVHAAGTTWWIDRIRTRSQELLSQGTYRQQLAIVAKTATLLVLLHIFEVAVWAVAYLLLPGLKSISTFEQALYFSTVTFTSLGYGDVVIIEPWRLLSGIQAMTGLLLFGWSTALLFAILKRLEETKVV